MTESKNIHAPRATTSTSLTVHCVARFAGSLPHATFNGPGPGSASTCCRHAVLKIDTIITHTNTHIHDSDWERKQERGGKGDEDGQTDSKHMCAQAQALAEEDQRRSVKIPFSRRKKEKQQHQLLKCSLPLRTHQNCTPIVACLSLPLPVRVRVPVCVCVCVSGGVCTISKYHIRFQSVP